MNAREVPGRSLILLLAICFAVGGARQWGSARQANQLGLQAAAQARAGDIVMLGSETCAVCAIARAWFKANRIAYSECLIERDPDCRARFDAGGYEGTPVILVRGRAQLGFSPEQVTEALAKR